MIDDILQIFKDNRNKWMNYKEIFRALNERKFNWGSNMKGSVGHKNMISRELSARHKDKFEVDKSVRPQKYRLKNYEYDKRNDDEEINSEISIDIFVDNKEKDKYIESGIKSNQDDLVENEEDITDEFILDIQNLQFEEYEVPAKVRKEKEKKNKENKPRKIDYVKRTIRNKNKGDLGEKAVTIIEKNKLLKLGRKDLADNVKWVSKVEGDGFGYDIESWRIVDEEVEKIYIEVKTTTGDKNTPFDISVKEVLVSKELGEKYYIYRVFGIEKITSKINYYIINGDIEKRLDLEPTSFKAYLKAD